MMKETPLILISITIGLIITSCSTQSDHQVEHLELNGVPVVRTNGGPKYDGPLFEVTSDLVLGTDFEEPEWQLFRTPVFFLVASDGRMILSDLNRTEFFIVSPEGELITRAGRKGAGPGEFSELGPIYWVEDSEEFMVRDSMLRRYVRYSVDGEFLGNISYPLDRGSIGPYYSLGNDRFIGRSSQSRSDMWTDSYVFLDGNFGIIGSFLDLTYPAIIVEIEGRWLRVPYAREDGITISPDGRILSFHPTDGRLTVYSKEDKPILHIEREWQRKRISVFDRITTRGWMREYNGVEDRRIRNRIPFPITYPAFSRARVDGNGCIWVERITSPVYSDREAMLTNSPARYVFDIFGPDGVWLGVQEMSLNPSFYRGDYVIRAGHFHYTYQAESGALRFERFDLRPLLPEVTGR